MLVDSDLHPKRRRCSSRRTGTCFVWRQSLQLDVRGTVVDTSVFLEYSLSVDDVVVDRGDDARVNRGSSWLGSRGFVNSGVGSAGWRREVFRWRKRLLEVVLVWVSAED